MTLILHVPIGVVSEHLTDSEVYKKDLGGLFICSEQDIFGLQVSMQHPFYVKSLQHLDHLIGDL